MLYKIRLPKGQPFNPVALASVTTSLAKRYGKGTQQPPLEYGIEATYQEVSFNLRYFQEPEIPLEEMATLVRAFYPDAQVERPYAPEVTLPAKTRVIVLPRAYNLPQDAVQLPLAAARAQTDPLVALVQAMSSLEPGEFIDYTLITFGTARWKTPLWGRIIAGMANEYLRQNDPHGHALRRMQEDKRREAKRKQELYHVAMSFRMTTPNAARLHLLSTVASTLRFMADDLYPLFDEQVSVDFETANAEQFYEHNYTAAYQQLGNKVGDRIDFAVLPDEIAMLWHLPHVGMENSKIKWTSTLPTALLTDGGAHPQHSRIGVVEAQHVALNRGDRRYHTYITGQTGMGKSTLLHNLIDEDLAAGCGIAVLDPHGTLINDILQVGFPEKRLADVLLLECGDTQYPVPLNPLRTPPGISPETVFTTVLWILQSIYAKHWSATRMETTFRNILQVILTDANVTPLDIQEVIINPNFRRKKVAEHSLNLSRAARNWWSLFDEASGSEQRSQTQAVLSRLSAFLGTPHVERMTCHPKTIDFRQLIRDKRIVLINLKGDAIGSEVDSLGAIFLAQFYLSSLSLGDVPGEGEPRFYLYVDEVQRFITSSLPEMFSEARKFGLSLTLANQYIGQLDKNTSEGILKNVGTKISFACHPDEAQETYRMYAPDIEREQLSQLAVGTAAVSTRYQGQPQPAFIVHAYDPLERAAEAPNLAAFRQQTRDYFGMIPAAAVNQWINQRYDGELFKNPPVATGLTDYEPNPPGE